VISEADPRILTYPEEYDNSLPDDVSFPEFILQRIVRWDDKVACVSEKSYIFTVRIRKI
jgi:hypothetical protein